MQFLGKRENLSELQQPHEPNTTVVELGKNIQPEPKSNLLSSKLQHMAATPSTVSQQADERANKPRAFFRENNPLLHEIFDSGLEFQYRKSRIEEMSQYLAPFASLQYEHRARQAAAKNPLLQSNSKKADSFAIPPGVKERPVGKTVPLQRDARGNMLLRAENELEYLETAYDFLEGYLREESPEDLEELSQLSGIPISEFEFWLHHKLDLVNTLKDIQKKF